MASTDQTSSHPLRTSTFTFPSTSRLQLESYMPPPTPSPSPTSPSSTFSSASSSRPFTTLTYATSLDSTLAYSPGVYTALSSEKSMSMTHYLRSRYDGILIGVGTAVADDPGLNCRLDVQGGGEARLQQQPRPIILDPHARWKPTPQSKLCVLAREKQGLAPWILTFAPPETWDAGAKAALDAAGGRYLFLDETYRRKGGQVHWPSITRYLKGMGIQSLLIDGGAATINSWLDGRRDAWMEIDTVVITIAPLWLGRGGVVVCPERGVDEGHEREQEQGEGRDSVDVVKRLTDVSWIGMGSDGVVCGRLGVAA